VATYSKEDKIRVKCERFRDGLCSRTSCNAASINTVGSHSCSLDKKTHCNFYQFHCPDEFVSTNEDGTKADFMKLVDDDRWPLSRNPNLLFRRMKKS
jgi:hypothetical protein